MSRFTEYLERTTPLLVEQFSKFWRSEYLYLNVLNKKGSNLGRLGIELNSRIATNTSRNLRSVWLNNSSSSSVFNLSKTVYQGYPALKMTFNTQSPSLGNFVDSELNSNHTTEPAELTPQPGDIIRPDSSDALYIICAAKPIEPLEKENNNEETQTQASTASSPSSTALFDFIKVGTISNVNGYGILQEVTSQQQENVDLQTNEFGTYKKLLTIKFMKFYVVVSLLSFYVVHFTGYKGETTVPNQELHDLLMKHH